jgi:sodium-dependent dicarboxylate transporter 2/3/5
VGQRVNHLLTRRQATWVLALLLPIIIGLLPATAFPFTLTQIEQRVIAIFVFAALFWILEPIPIYATSMLIVILELVFISDSNLLLLRSAAPDYGTPLSYKEIMGSLASPIIMLFLGGFFLAVAATKYRLDQNVAGLLLPRFGTQPRWVLLGMMCIAGFFSMFMSNTATTAMMLAILLPVVEAFPPGDRSRTAFVIGIPVAANLGGIGTPIGTPANAIALKFLGESALSFSKWMLFGVPFVIVLILLAWVLITQLWPSSGNDVKVALGGKFLRTPKALVVYATFLVTIAMWILDFVHGMNAYVVGLIPVGVFLLTGVINKEDLKLISWDVLWLVGGGIALGLAIDHSGLAHTIIAHIPFAGFAPWAVIAGAGGIGLLLANFMSHTATANLLLPLLVAVGAVVPGLTDIGGTNLMILATTLAISLAMSLPISTPPNALAHATGMITTKDLMKVGILMGVVGFVLLMGLIFMLGQTRFIG